MKNQNIGISIIRVALGLTMLIHGIVKATSINSTVNFFSSLGLPSIMAYIIMGIEIIGGILMILSLAVPFASFFFTVTLIGAIATFKIHEGYLGGYEYELFLAVVSTAIGIYYFQPDRIRKWL